MAAGEESGLLAHEGAERDPSLEKTESDQIPVRCPRCGSTEFYKNGHKPDGRQRWQCKVCGRE